MFASFQSFQKAYHKFLTDIVREVHVERQELKIGSRAPTELFTYILALAQNDFQRILREKHIEDAIINEVRRLKRK